MKNKEKPVIEFISRIKFLQDVEGVRPQPAQKFIPDWWKNAPYFNHDEDSNTVPEFSYVRHCPMFPDLFSSGYILPMWADTTIKFSNGEWSWKCGSYDSPFRLRIFEKEQFLEHTDYKFNGVKATAIFQFENPWQIKVSKGYSLFQLPLFYHFNNDFSALPGTYDANIINTDKLEMAYFGEEKEIFIKKGTPLVQFLPYKKEKIELIVRERNKNDENEFLKNMIKRQTTFKNWYAQNRHRG